MEDFWNSKILNPPPTQSFKCKSPAIDLNNVRSILTNGIQTFIAPTILRVESAIMRRVIYRLKLQYRTDKGFKLFENTNRNLNHFFEFNIIKDLVFLLNEVPKKYDKDFYFPSRQMLQYVLVRLQGYAQLCSKVVESSFATTTLMRGRIGLGHQWETAAVILAICSRIWLVCRNLTTKCCLLYNELLPLLYKVEITGTKWLPDDYILPIDLTDWLNYDWLLETPDVILQLPLELPVFSLLDDDENFAEHSGRYELNKNKTIVIADDSDDEEYDDSGNVKFVCSFNKSYVKLDSKVVKQLESKIINIDDESDSGSDSDSVEILDFDKFGYTSGSLGNILIDEEKTTRNDSDSDVQIVEPAENKREQVKDSLNVRGNAPLTVSDDDNDDADDDDEEEEEVQEPSDKIPVQSQDNETNSASINLPQNNKTSSDNDIGEPVIRKLESSPSTSKTTLKDRSVFIYLKGKRFSVNTINELQSFMSKENDLRNEGNSYISVSYDLSADDWAYLSFQIKYFIALAQQEPDESIKYIEKAKTLLKEVLDYRESDDSDDSFDLNNPVILTNTEEITLMTLKGKKYLLNSIDSAKDLQLFIEKENDLRKRTPYKCVFANLDADEWVSLAYKLKYYIVKATQQPIQSKMNIKQAKTLLITHLRDDYNEIDSDSYSDDSDIEEMKKMSRIKFDEIYLGIRTSPNWQELFNYVTKLEDRKVPPKMTKEMKKKLREEQEKLITDLKQTVFQDRKMTKKIKKKIQKEALAQLEKDFRETINSVVPVQQQLSAEAMTTKLTKREKRELRKKEALNNPEKMLQAAVRAKRKQKNKNTASSNNGNDEILRELNANHDQDAFLQAFNSQINVPMSSCSNRNNELLTELNDKNPLNIITNEKRKLKGPDKQCKKRKKNGF